MIVSALILSILTALASALHGHNSLSKWLLVVMHCAACAGVGFLMGLGWWLPLGAVAALLWWATLRRGAQAEAELDYMDAGGSIWPVIRAYWPTLFVGGLLPALSVFIFNYRTAAGRWLGWNHGRFWDCRRPTEIAGGVTGGVYIWALLVAAGFLMEKFNVGV